MFNFSTILIKQYQFYPFYYLHYLIQRLGHFPALLPNQTEDRAFFPIAAVFRENFLPYVASDSPFPNRFKFKRFLAKCFFLQNMNNQNTDSDSDWIHAENLRNVQPDDQFADTIISERLSLVDEEYLVALCFLVSSSSLSRKGGCSGELWCLLRCFQFAFYLYSILILFHVLVLLCCSFAKSSSITIHCYNGLYDRLPN